MRDSKADFEFLDFARPSRPHGSAEPQKSASTGRRGRGYSKPYASPDSAVELIVAAAIAVLVLLLAKWFAP